MELIETMLDILTKSLRRTEEFWKTIRNNGRLSATTKIRNAWFKAATPTGPLS